MRILVTGASGLIGRAVCARLEVEGHEVVRVYRRPPRGTSGGRVIVQDFSDVRGPQDWVGHLEGIDAVVNCAGVLQDGPRDSTSDVHAAGAAALFTACEQVGVRKVIHFSALGVDRAQPSAFSASKLAGDEALTALDLDWVILRPSVVLGRAAFGASALMRGLAALPLLPAMPDTGALQVVQLDDVVSTVVELVRPAAPSRLVIELVGPEPLTMTEIIGRFRHWLGWRPARVVVLPRWAAGLLYRLGDLAGLLGWRPPVRSNAGREIVRGATGDPGPWTAATGIVPASLAGALAAAPATVQERWFADLYLVKPATFAILPFFWVATGIVSLTTGWGSGRALLLDTPVGGVASELVVAGALADIAVGAMIAWRPSARLGLWGAVALCLFYLVAGSMLRPDLWNEPLGPLLKILPILAIHVVALAILEER